MTSAQRSPKVVVSGDVTMDWNLARVRRLKEALPAWNADDRTRASWQRGGAAMLADLIEAVANTMRRDGEANWAILKMGSPTEPVHPLDDRFHHSYAMWSQFSHGKASGSGGEGSAWRVDEFLGLDPSPVDGPADWQRVVGDTPEVDLVVIDDAALGFRTQPGLWPQAVPEGECHTPILLKMARPVAQGALWEHLRENCADRLIVVMTVNDLRRTEVQISRELSWERTAQDLFWELTHNPRVNALSRCAHVVISFDTAGAFLLSGAGTGSGRGSDRESEVKCRLFFDPKIVEGMWGQDRPGRMIGYTSCLAAAIARQIMLDPARPDLPRGIQAGLAAMRLLHQKGYEEQTTSTGQPNLVFPAGMIADSLASAEPQFAVAEVQDPARFLSRPASQGTAEPEAGLWSILKDRYTDTLDKVAQEIVLKGVEAALEGVPLGQFDKLVTADRREIESLRSIRSLIAEYCRQSQNRPLCIAVFGPPGSGKSFAVKQVARSVCSDDIKPLEFNLSQIGGHEGLLDALHQVRDIGLAGQIPLVFWDEFDTAFDGQPLGWLRYFLAPMQDGSFQHGQITHPIGRCIFVFAGGTCARVEDFPTVLPDDKEFARTKGPDFISRLKGYVNILGPNPQVSAGDKADPYHVIRRAIMLRFVLYNTARQIFQRQNGGEVPSVDPGVLRALLHTREYKHGVRSMEAIVAMSLLAGRSSFERSCLPAEAQLDLHVDGREFLSLAQQIELEGDLLEDLAEAAHDIFCEGRMRDGWKLGPRNDAEKTHPLLVPYADLPETYKEANRVNVRNIPKKLAAAGYVMIPSRSSEPPLEFPPDDLETLAHLEHELWMEDRFAAGFALGVPTDEDLRRNPYLVEWEEVPEEIKNTDRDLVRGMPQIAARAGYAIVKLRGGTQRP
jgi:hypothetical protein